MYFVYLIENEQKKKYIGYTNDIKRRLKDHNTHQNKSTSNGIWKLIYCEVYVHKMDAIGREKFLKGGSGWRYIRKQLKFYFEEQKKLLS